MNKRREKFCFEYAATGNATKAAEAAGYSSRTARSQGQRLLTFVDVQARIAEIAEQVESEKIASIKDVQAFWTDIMKDAGEKTADRLKATELLVKSKGGFTTTLDIECGVREDVVFYVPDNGRGPTGKEPDDEQ